MPFFPKRVAAVAAILACAMASPAFAADRSAMAVTGLHTDFSAVQARRSALLAAPRTVSATSHAATASATAAVVTASSYRAYPASCFSDIVPTSNVIELLPSTPVGVLYSKNVTLFEVDQNGNNSAEDVTITIFRVACSSSGATLSYNPDGGYVGATLMRIQRQSAYEGDTTVYPRFPDVRVAQGNIAFDNTNYTDYVRVANEPNTVFADTAYDSALINSTTYVLENYSSPTLGYFYFNNAFTIRFWNGYTDSSGSPASNQFTISVPAYNPTSSTYPVAFAPMAVNGYLSGLWGAPPPSIGSREGVVTQVLDNSDGVTRTFLAYWYTYDSLGLPFWLVAQTSFPIGTTQLLNVPVYYATGGDFAATTPPSPPVVSNSWGTLNVSFSDCQHIQIGYSGATGTVSSGPGGSGTLKWTRLSGTNINNLACE